MVMNPLKIFMRYKNLKMPHRVSVSNRRIPNSVKIPCRSCSSAFNEKFCLNEDNDFYSKIIYNEVLYKVPVTKKKGKPIFLKYLNENNCPQKNEIPNETKTEPEIVNFPFKIREEVLPKNYANPVTVDNDTSNEENTDEGKWEATKYPVDVNNLEDFHKWNATKLLDDTVDDTIKFGTCNPNMPVSKIPCGGCGAVFQCNDPSIPGFLPKEVFDTISIGNQEEELRAHICQRCHFLKAFNVALGVHVPPSQYEQIISSLRSKTGLVIFMVDLLDFPCSIYPEILNLIGPTKPVVVVGNKVDLLMQENPSFLRSFENSLLCSLKERNFNVNNIKHVALISAKTGYGLENLVTTLQEYWENQGDVYLIGCTNVGKSSLFNALIQSDYCKVDAADILQRATVSPWPGTTLNLLKFPIAKILTWKLAARRVRLTRENVQRLAIERLQYLGENIKFQQIPLTDYVGRTFARSESPNSSDSPAIEEKKLGFNPNTQNNIFAKWFYDTPGVVHEDQILNLLTTSELLLALPTKIVAPRNFYLTPGHSLFIGGLARLDYISGPDFAWFTVFASQNLPITVTKLEDADLVYQKLLGTPLFVVPNAGKKRLSNWPNLASKRIEIFGKPQRELMKENKRQSSGNTKEADADVVLTSAGWVSVNISPPFRCILEAWTPEGRGIHVRNVPLIKKGHIFRGKRIGRTPAFECVVQQVSGYSIKDKPPF